MISQELGSWRLECDFSILGRRIRLAKRHGRVVPLWDKWTGSIGQRPVHCPTLSHLIWRPPCPSSILSRSIWRPPCPCPTYPTSNLSQPVPFGCTTCPFPTPLFQIFVWVSHCHSTFRKTLLPEMFSPTYHHVREGRQQANFRGQISMEAYSWFWSEPASEAPHPQNQSPIHLIWFKVFWLLMF